MHIRRGLLVSAMLLSGVLGLSGCAQPTDGEEKLEAVEEQRSEASETSEASEASETTTESENSEASKEEAVTDDFPAEESVTEETATDGEKSDQEATGEAKAKVTFVIDDGYADLPEIKAVFDKYQMKACAAIITDMVGKSEDYITEAQLHEFYDNGWEILSHSKTHKTGWDKITSEEVRQECQESKAYFDTIGIPVSGIVVPYVFLPADDQPIVAEYYDYCFASGDTYTDDSPVISRAHFTSQGEHSVDEMKQGLDRLVETGGWKIYFFHYTRQIGQWLVTPDMTIEVLDDVLSYIADKEGQIQVVLPRDTCQS